MPASNRARAPCVGRSRVHPVPKDDTAPVVPLPSDLSTIGSTDDLCGFIIDPLVSNRYGLGQTRELRTQVFGEFEIGVGHTLSQHHVHPYGEHHAILSHAPPHFELLLRPVVNPAACACSFWSPVTVVRGSSGTQLYGPSVLAR